MLKEIKYSKTFQKSLRSFKELNLKLRRSLGLKKLTYDETIISSSDFNFKKPVLIYTSASFANVADLIQKHLKNFSISSEIVYTETIEVLDRNICFIVGLYNLPVYPEKYIFFQTQKINLKDAKQLDVLKNATFILDYSIENIGLLENTQIPYQQLFYTPIAVEYTSNVETSNEILNLYENETVKNGNKLRFSGSSFCFYFNRFLLSNNVISYQSFLDNTDHPTLTKNFVCLTLPETVSRTESFRKDTRSFIEIFHGLRNSIGWIGCGLSYKYLMYLAKRQQLDYLIICEDDVAFPEDLDSKLEVILDYLKLNKNKWDLFSGFIADVHRETDVRKVETFKRIEFVHIDKLMSMVFNIYNNSFFEQLEKWNEKNLNKETNTIDRFIERSEGLKIITSFPYLVGLKEDLSSSIWDNVQNDVYNILVNKSTRILDYKIKWYKRKNKWKSALFKK
jgi:hypothetical protein